MGSFRTFSGAKWKLSFRFFNHGRQIAAGRFSCYPLMASTRETLS